MNHNEMIETAAQAMAAVTYAHPDAWDVWVTDEKMRNSYRDRARAALDAVGALTPEHGHRPLVPEGHVTVDLSGYGLQIIKVSANGPHGYPLADTARAELARRGESS